MNATSFRNRRYPNIALWAAALVCLNVACFRSLDVSKVKCNSASTCPSPYFCSNGHCVLALDGGNGPVDGAHGADGASVAIDARPNGGNGGGPVDSALGAGGTPVVFDAQPGSAGGAGGGGSGGANAGGGAGNGGGLAGNGAGGSTGSGGTSGGRDAPAQINDAPGGLSQGQRI